MGAVKNLELEYKVDLSSFKNHLEKSAQGIDDILKIYHDAIKASSRESKLQQQIQELKIEIEKSKRNAQTAEIVDSEFFRDLNYKAKKMRESITKNKTNP